MFVDFCQLFLIKNKLEYAVLYLNFIINMENVNF